MKLTQFSPPGAVPDLKTPAIQLAYSQHISQLFARAVARVKQAMASAPGSVVQFYNPLTHGLPDPDTLADIGQVGWHGLISSAWKLSLNIKKTC